MCCFLYNTNTMHEAGLTFLMGGHAPDVVAFIDTRGLTYHSLQFITHGRLHLWVGAQFFDLSGPWMWVNAAGVVARYQAAPRSGRWEHRYLGFRGPLAQHWLNTGLLSTTPQRLPDDDDYVERFDQLLSLAFENNYWAKRRAVVLLEQILLALAQARTQEQTEQTWIAQVLARFKGIRGTPRQYRAIAADLGVSVATLRRRFRNAMGASPHQWLLRERIYQAQNLLTNTDEPLKQIADRLGYCDVYHFNRHFRKLAGLPPATFRRLSRAKEIG